MNRPVSTSVLLVLAACSRPEGDAPAPVAEVQAPAEAALWFVDRSEGVGLEGFQSRSGGANKDYVTESFGAGLALFDYDDDGHLDLYCVGGGVYDLPEGQSPPADRLFAGDGTGQFTDVTEEAGIRSQGWTYGVHAADLDGDGYQDLFVTAAGRNTFWRNRGDGSFEDRSLAAGFTAEEWSTGAASLDFDGDGDLDLWVVNHIQFDKGTIDEEHRRDEYLDQTVYFGPRGLPPLADRLYRNRGDGTFEDVSDAAGIRQHALFGFQAIVFDADQDGRPDVYVANDSQPNQLWRNVGDGTFEDIALRRGAALSMEGGPQAGMGIAVGDADGDGATDLFVTNFSEDYFTLYRGDGKGAFRDVTRRSRLMQPTLRSLGWGAVFEDFDLDGDLDLLCANGHVFPQMDLVPAGPGYAQRDQVFENLGDGTFAVPAGEGGPALTVPRASRGLASGDLDGDGDLDLAVGVLDGAPRIYRNEGAGLGRVLVVELEGQAPNTDALGSRVELTAGGRKDARYHGSGQGFLSSSARPLHFGLGTSERVTELRVTWPDGSVTTEQDLPTDRRAILRQGEGLVDLVRLQR